MSAFTMFSVFEKMIFLRISVEFLELVSNSTLISVRFGISVEFDTKSTKNSGGRQRAPGVRGVAGMQGMHPAGGGRGVAGGRRGPGTGKFDP